MKKALGFLFFITLLAGLAFALIPRRTIRRMAVRSGLEQSPYYQLGDTEWDNGGVEEYYFNQLPSSYNAIYRELYTRLSSGEDSAEIFAAVTETTVAPEERPAMKAALDQAAAECIAQTDETWSDYGRIKSVYEYIINTTEYNASAPDNQCVQSALLSHASVCAGYAKAFQYILHRMGYFCTYITGTIPGGGDHAWNVVRIDGNYYHVDVTWGDPVFAGNYEGGTGLTVMNYNYLCCTDAEILPTHTPDGTIPLPECTDGSYNFYRINGMYYDTFDRDVIYNALMESVHSGSNSVVMKFGSREAYDAAKQELFTNKLYYDADQYLMEQNGVTTWNNRYSTDDDFFVITIQWF